MPAKLARQFCRPVHFPAASGPAMTRPSPGKAMVVPTAAMAAATTGDVPNGSVLGAFGSTVTPGMIARMLSTNGLFAPKVTTLAWRLRVAFH